MLPKLTVKRSIQIHASVKIVWKVLTDPEFIPRYMYGCQAITDWHPGSKLLWMNLEENKAYVKGHIIQRIPHELLQYTSFDLNGHLRDIPRNYSVFTWELKENDGITTLSVIQTGFEYMEDGKEHYKHAAESEDEVLHKIKAVAEGL